MQNPRNTVRRFSSYIDTKDEYSDPIRPRKKKRNRKHMRALCLREAVTSEMGSEQNNRTTDKIRIDIHSETILTGM